MSTIGALRRDEAIANPPQTGTVIEGSLKTEDKVRAFIGELDRIYAQKPRDATDTVAEARSWMKGEEAYFRDFPDVTGDYGEIGAEIASELMDRLNDAAPDGTHFGTHPGDGADFGFWPDDTPDDPEP